MNILNGIHIDIDIVSIIMNMHLTKNIYSLLRSLVLGLQCVKVSTRISSSIESSKYMEVNVRRKEKTLQRR